MEMEMVSLDDLGDLSLHLIALKLGPKDTACIACVNRRLRVSAAEEILWRTFCNQDLNLSDPLDPSGNPAPNRSFKLAYKTWRRSFSMYPWPLVKRVKACWDTLNNWLSANFPQAKDTLQKGASEEEIKHVEDKLGVKLPLSTKLLYRFCNGQNIPNQNVVLDTHLGSPLGIIGGYSFYDHCVNVYLLPLSQVVVRSKQFVRQLGFGNRSRYIVVAASSTYTEKLFFLNYITGQLYVGTINLSTDGEMVPCVSVPASSQRDAMLLWLEEHGRRLQTGMIQLRKEAGKVPRINLFPETGPLCSTAVTNGVKIRSSSVFVPELSNLQGDEKYMFAYSIRMSLLPEGCIANGTFVSSCQLYYRHWIIRANDVVVADVDGEGVIGEYPVLHCDCKEFVYESCTPLPSCPGSVEGAFTFVPGRILANRRSAGKSKWKRRHYTEQLLVQEKTLELEKSTLAAKVVVAQLEYNGLAQENLDLKMRLRTLAGRHRLQEGQTDELLSEFLRLRSIAESMGLNQPPAHGHHHHHQQFSGGGFGEAAAPLG